MARVGELKPGDWVRPVYGKRWLGIVVDVTRPNENWERVKVEPYFDRDALDHLKGGVIKVTVNSRLEKIPGPEDYLFWKYSYAQSANTAGQLNEWYLGIFRLDEVRELSLRRWMKKANVIITSENGIRVQKGEVLE